MAIGPITIGALIGGGVAGAALKMKEVFNGEAAHYWGSDTGWNDSSDAFRHAYVSARFAQMTGEHTANILGMFNEVISKSDDSRDAAMDVWNNKVGAEIGSKYEMTDEYAPEKIANDIKKALDNGLLVTDFEKDPRTNGKLQEFLDKNRYNNPFDDLPDDLAEAFAKWAGINRSGFHYFYDPIVLDLDGDGIETIAHDKLKKAVFDHDGDGIAHATGWVKKDDGILVLDRNGDGVINDGREVFGDSMILSTGETAKHGYEALADLDSDGNGKINADDTKFDELRVWRDLDSDGVSDVGELFGLHELGISALNLDYQEVDKNLTGGNKLTQLGSYEKHDGKTGVMGDVNFNFHGVYTKHLDGVKNTDDRLPNLQGSGRVRSLSEAMTLSSELRNIVVNYLNAKSKDEQLSMMDGLLKAWAKTDPDYQDYEKPIFLSIRSSSSQKGAVGIAGGGGAIPTEPKICYNTPMAYSDDFRQQVLRQLNCGKTYRQLAEEYNISTRTILNWKAN
ncbi:helix-turn-helix domain-containing protein, partial [Moraxella equi]